MATHKEKPAAQGRPSPAHPVFSYGTAWRVLVMASALLLLVACAALGTWIYIRASLPSIDGLHDYQPLQTSTLYSDDGRRVGQLFEERRTVVAIESIPDHVVRAFLAAEDADFYEHQGLDYLGIVRAMVKNLRPGAHLQGASTITQQTVKTLVVGPERSYMRKIREAMLSLKLEQILSKDEILHLYLNQIYFGSGAYGVEEAARTYFGRSVRELDLADGAILAAIPKNPSGYNPIRHPDAAYKRRAYVLEQMQAKGWISAEQVQAANSKRFVESVGERPYVEAAAAYNEHVRQYLVKRYGDKKVLTGGLTVYLAMNAQEQLVALSSLRQGLERVAREQGYAGPSRRIEVDRYDAYLGALRDYHRAAIATKGESGAQALYLWDLSAVKNKDLVSQEAFLNRVGLMLLDPDGRQAQRVGAIVTKVDSVSDLATVDLGCCVGTLTLEDVAWARPFAPEHSTASPRDIAQVMRPGDLIEVKIFGLLSQEPQTRPVAKIEWIAEPQLQGALVAMDPHTRFVSAMLGGYDAAAGGGFNRATQALRQPGSAFKPVVYAAGLQAKVMTPSSICPDTPIVIRDAWSGKAWKPENFEDGRFDGNITYRTALMKSKNTCSVKLIEKLGPKSVIDVARAVGITAALPENLTLALGTGELTPLELTNAYATIAASGLYAEPVFVRKVVDVDGTVLEENQSQPRQALEPAVAFVLTTMMRAVVEEGTAQRARVLERPLAGKTGTTNQSRDVWFSGFSAERVATVWLGFDDNRPLGRSTGSSAALPIWIDFMTEALQGVAAREFVAPSDVVFVKVDPETGNPTDDVTAIEQAFIAGSEPTERNAPLPSIFVEDEPL